MSITPELRNAAFSAYRQLFRAARFTFRGDERVLTAFIAKTRADALAARTETDPEIFAQHNANGLEAADFLRKNVVQATKTQDDKWQLHFTEETELGSNDTIKSGSGSGPVVESSRGARKRESSNLGGPQTGKPPAHAPSISPLYFSSLKKAHNQRVIPELREEDLDESFVRGSGPGGQSVNKTENNVQLLHRPTGIRVSCQETRSLATNRRLARRLILQKLDEIANPGLSKEQFRAAKQRERERRRRKKAKKKQAGLKTDNGADED